MATARRPHYEEGCNRDEDKFDFEPWYYQPLRMVQFSNNRQYFRALVDTGAQLNLVNERYLPRLLFEDADYPCFRVRGLGGLTQQIKRWIYVQVHPGPIPKRDGFVECWVTPFAVLEHTPSPFLLGLPYLVGVNATIDFAARKMITDHGTFTLLEQPTAPGNCGQASTITIEDVEDGEEEQVQDSWVPPATTPSPGKTEEQQLQLTVPEAAPLLNAPHLPPEKHAVAEALLRKFAHLWAPDRKLGCTIGEHIIEVTSSRPIVQRQRRFTEQEQQVIEKEVNAMLEAGVIRPSTSSYASQPVLVLKKTGEIRFCLDYRCVNKITKLNAHTLPIILELIYRTHGSQWYVALDLKAGYWQIPMHEESVQYTAFGCNKGLYEFLYMPFGLTNAPATFQRTMETVFGDLQFRGVLVYLDDILVHAPSFEETVALLEEVFTRLDRHNFTVNYKKSNFFPEALRYLGHILSRGSIRPDPERVATLSKIEPPKTVHDVRALLGFLGYFHIYIPRFAELLEPVFALLRGLPKNTKRANKITAVEWAPQCQKGVDQAIEALKISTLHLPVDGEDFLVETDASDHTVAATLSVKKPDGNQPVMFVSKSLDKTQRNWPVREKEAFAIIYALQKFDTFVRGRRITVHTDHESLQWLMEAKKGKLARWATLLAEYDFEVFYKKGSTLQHVDFLTRHITQDPDPLEDRMCFVVIASALAGGIDEEETTFPTIEEVREAQQQLPARPTAAGFHKVDDLIFYRGKIFPPPSLTARIVRAAHQHIPFAHPGIRRTLAIANRAFNWPKARADVSRYLASCLKCKRAKIGSEELQGRRKSHPPAGILEQVYMDFFTVTYDGVPYELLNLIDSLSKWAECYVVPDKTTTTVASVLQERWISRFGTPRVLVSDRDRSFTASLLQEMCQNYGITRWTSAPYHPEGNAVVEAFHKTLNLGLRYVNPRHLPFKEALAWILYGYRVTPHTSTRESPGFLLYGVDLRPPIDDDWRFPLLGPESERLRLLQTIREEVRLRTHVLLEKQTAKANEERRPTTFELGQLVCCHQHPLQQAHYKRPAYKALPTWTIPYRVVKVLQGGASAVLLCILTHTRREAHITDVRHILPPVDDVQRQEWATIIEEEVWPSFFEPGELQEIMNNYFVPLEQVLQSPSTATKLRPPRRQLPTPKSRKSSYKRWPRPLRSSVEQAGPHEAEVVEAPSLMPGGNDAETPGTKDHDPPDGPRPTLKGREVSGNLQFLPEGDVQIEKSADAEKPWPLEGLSPVSSVASELSSVSSPLSAKSAEMPLKRVEPAEEEGFTGSSGLQRSLSVRKFAEVRKAPAHVKSEGFSSSGIVKPAVQQELPGPQKLKLKRAAEMELMRRLTSVKRTRLTEGRPDSACEPELEE